MKTAVIYARYSSERQTEQSIEGQLRVCNEYAERNDIVVVNTYIDRATTGTNDNRVYFQQMLKDSKKQAWDIVIVYKLDRFSRSKYEMAIHRRTLRDNGIRLISAMENIPDSPEGIILESMLEGMAEYYSAELSQKIRRGLNESRRKGNSTGGKTLYGYKSVNKKIEIDEDKAEVVRFIFQQYAAGVIVPDIITALQQKGILNKGKPFIPNTIYTMLRNERYIGVYRFKDEVYTNLYPPIISTELFEIIRQKTEENQYGKKSLEAVYLLRSKMVCGYCGRGINAETGTARSGKIERYYKCNGRKRGSDCKKQIVKKDTIENLVIQSINQVLHTPEVIEKYAECVIAERQKRLQDQSILNILLKELNETQKAINNIMTAIEQGIITNSTKKRLEELEERQSEISCKITIERAKQTVRQTKTEIAEFIKEALRREPKQMIEMLINKIILFDDKIEIFFNTNDKNPDTERDLPLYSGSTYLTLSPP